MFLNRIFSKKNKAESFGIQTDDFTKFEQVDNLIKKELKHFVQSHNGKILLVAVVENNVYINLSGTCSSCPAIEITLNGFISKVLKEKLPWFNKVINLK